MIPVFQIANNECLRAAVASILELRLEDVPHFPPSDGQEQIEGLQVWLKQRGLWYFEKAWKDEDPMVLGCFGHGEHWIGTCDSKISGKSHAFVATLKEEDGAVSCYVAHNPWCGEPIDFTKYKLNRIGLIVPVSVAGWKTKI